MSIKQFQGNYVVNDDRILFRFNTLDDNEFKFWLTRRVTQFILVASDRLIQQQLGQKHDQIAAKAISEFQQQSLKETADTSTEYQSARNYPIGSEAVLVIDVNCSIVNIENQEIFSLVFILPGGGNINLKLPLPGLQTLRLLLENLNQQANWGQPILLLPQETNPPPPLEEAPKKIH